MTTYELGKTYLINFKDSNYPCDCECHLPGRNILHFDACCWDRSYYGPAEYVGMHPDVGYYLFKLPNSRRVLMLLESSVGGEVV